MFLYVSVTVALALSAVSLAVLSGLFVWEGSAPWRIRPERGRKLQGPKFQRRIWVNGIFSGGLVFAYVFAFGPWLFHADATPWWHMVLEAVALVMIYDFAYYLTHRFAFHKWGPLVRVHALHHGARYPKAVDALYVHPIESLIGLSLLFASIWLVGPVHVYTFGVVFLIYSSFNIAIHCGMDFPQWPLRPLAYMARKHDRHHKAMKAGNFASITPLFDFMFGTAE